MDIGSFWRLSKFTLMASRRRLLGYIPRCTGILANLAFSMHFGFRPHINSFLDDSKLSFWKNSFKSEDFRKNMFLHLHADNIKGVLAKVTGVHLYLQFTSDCVPYNCLLHYISSRLCLYCHLLLWRCFLDELWGGMTFLVICDLSRSIWAGFMIFINGVISQYI